MARIFLTQEELQRIDQNLRGLAQQQDDGSFLLEHLIQEGQGLAFESVSGLKSALEKERQRGRSLDEQLKGFEGLDASAARDALTKVKEMANWDPDKEVAERIKAREQQLIQKHQQDMRGAEDKSKRYHDQLQTMLVENAATKALMEAGGSVALLLPHVKGSVRMRETENGQMIAEVIDPSSGAPKVGDSNGNPMTIPQLVAEMKNNSQFAPAFTGTGQTGSGSQGGAPSKSAPPATRGNVRKISVDDMNDNLEAIASGEAVVDLG